MAITLEKWAKLLQAGRVGSQDAVAIYVLQGRKYAGLSERELKDIFVRSVRERGCTGNANACPEGYDAESELILRGIDVPYDEVRDAVAAFQRSVTARRKKTDDESLAFMLWEVEAARAKARN